MARFISNFAFIVHRSFIQNRLLVYHSFNSFIRLKKSYKPIFLTTFLGLTFKKEEENKGENIVAKMADIQAQLEKADQLFDDNKFAETVDFLKTLDQGSADILWRLGRAQFKIAGTESASTKSDLIKSSYQNVHDALEKDDNNFAIHKWYAILLDAKSNLDGIKARVEQLETVKKHMLRAIELNPEDPTSRYILGEFQFGLADLPWYQRKIVSTIFATPPSASYEEALELFLKAESLKDNFYSMNKLMIAKCYIALKDNAKAKEFLTKASNISVLNEDDRKCKEEAEKLLSKF